MKINYEYVGNSEHEYTPKHETEFSSGADLRCNEDSTVYLLPKQGKLVKTGIKVEIPEGYEGQLRMRSSIATKKHIIIPNAPGTIDSDYRGEIMVSLFNIGSDVQIIAIGERIAQLIIAPYVKCEYNKKDKLTTTNRGSGGFGSTGK